MALDIDRAAYLKALDAAQTEKDKAARLGADLAKKGLKRVYLVGCGAPNREMGTIKYWMERVAKNLDVYLYFPAEFLNQKPPRMDENTLVVLGSHSGTTPEILAVAEWLKTLPVTTVGVTQKAESPLAQNVQHPLLYGESTHGYHAKFMIILALLSTIMHELEKDWTVHKAIMSSLDCFPSALVDTQEAYEAQSKLDAQLLKDDDYVMLLGAGPMFATAYVFGVCVLMEMQWMHTYACESAEFFHGPFEVVDAKSPVVVFLGEDPARPESERVVRFCQKFTERLFVFDSKDYEMKGIDPSVRAIFAPFILEAAVDRLAQRLAVWHTHPLTTRRYMWKFEY
jgi:fructoselysine 6-phosphate deglycase